MRDPPAAAPVPGPSLFVSLASCSDAPSEGPTSTFSVRTPGAAVGLGTFECGPPLPPSPPFPFPGRRIILFLLLSHFLILFYSSTSEWDGVLPSVCACRCGTGGRVCCSGSGRAALRVRGESSDSSSAVVVPRNTLLMLGRGLRRDFRCPTSRSAGCVCLERRHYKERDNTLLTYHKKRTYEVNGNSFSKLIWYTVLDRLGRNSRVHLRNELGARAQR